MREAHIFADADELLRFQLLAPIGVTRKLDCIPDQGGNVGGICFNVPDRQARAFQAAADRARVPMLWGGGVSAVPRWDKRPVVFVTDETPPGFDPEDEPRYPYRTIPSRWPLPVGEIALDYDVTIGLESRNPDTDTGTVIHSYKLGETDRWKGRPDPADRLTAFDALVISEEDLEREDILRGRQALDWEILEELGFDPTPGPIHSLFYADDYWTPGVLVPADLPGQVYLSLKTESIYFEEFNTAQAGDGGTYKITETAAYSGDDALLPLIKPGTRFNQEVYVMAVPQWWRFKIEWDGYAVIPDPTVKGKQWPVRPERPTYSPGPGWDGAPGVVDEIKNYRYWVTITTPAGESWPSFMSNQASAYTDDSVTPADQVRITIPAQLTGDPDLVLAVNLYRQETTVSDSPEIGFGTIREFAKLVHTFERTEEEIDGGLALGEREYFDNVADGSLGAAPPLFYPPAFGNAILGDHFWTGLTLEDWSDVAPEDSDPVTRAIGFWWCSSAPGSDWSGWTWCDAPEGTPPSSGCFDCDLIRPDPSSPVIRHFAIEGFKKALVRPVFPQESAPYSETAIDPSFVPVLTYTDDSGEVEFDCAGELFTEDAADLQTDFYESLILPGESTAEELRTLCKWAENSRIYKDYFLERVIDDVVTPSEYDEVLQGSDVDVSPVYWTANGLLTITQADTPIGGLVACVSVNGVRRYVWRRVASEGRSAAIVTSIAYDSVDDRMDLSFFTGEDPEIPRRRIRSAGDSPPS